MTKLAQNPFKSSPKVDTNDPTGSITDSTLWVVGIGVFTALLTVGVMVGRWMVSSVGEATNTDIAGGESGDWGMI